MHASRAWPTSSTNAGRPRPRAGARALLILGALACSKAQFSSLNAPPSRPRTARDASAPISLADARGADASLGHDPDDPPPSFPPVPSADASVPPDAPAPSAPPIATCTNPPCIDVVNDCPIPLWIHPLATVPIDGGTVRRLDPGQRWQYAALPQFGGGRLYAYYQAPDVTQETGHPVSDFNQFVEMTIDRDLTGAFAQNYNISYVDHLSLPVQMKADGACAATTCTAPFDTWLKKLASCPTELRNQVGGLGTCVASYDYCITPDGAARYDTTRPYCSKMQDAHGFPGSAVYGGTFPEHPAEHIAFWDGVAAWNRGVAAGDADDSHYYVTEPYNHYAAWIHRDLGCSGVYAFSTDDHQDKAGFVRCVSNQLSVIWCPSR
jgi:hypothetical protein